MISVLARAGRTVGGRPEGSKAAGVPPTWRVKPVNLIDLPRRCEEQLYRSTVDKVVTLLSTETYVDSIYQVGHVRHPGISDIDLLLVVADDAASKANPLEHLSVAERYLFTHSCFAVPASLAPDLVRHVLLHGCRHLHGTEWRLATDAHTMRALEVQTALEFLAKNLFDLYVQLTYEVLKVRVFLQHLKGVKLDLDITGIEGGRLAGLLEYMTSLTSDWFSRRDSDRQVMQTAVELLPLLQDALAEATARHTLYAPSGGTIRFARNMWLDRGETIDLAHRGLQLPRIPLLDDRRHFNAHHRINRFHFRLPMTEAQQGSYHASRFDFLSRAKAFTAERFPAYSAPIPPLFYRVL
jgi:hypothetical protein